MGSSLGGWRLLVGLLALPGRSTPAPVIPIGGGWPLRLGPLGGLLEGRRNEPLEADLAKVSGAIGASF